MAKRAEEVDATRRQILDAVVDVAAASGLEALTMQAVAERADVAVRTVYNHFESRDDLVASALARLAAETRSVGMSVTVDGRGPRDALLAFVDAYAGSYEAQGDGLRVLMDSLAVEVVADVVREVRTWRRRRLRSLVRAAEGSGDLRVPVAEAVDVAYLATAYATWATLTGDMGLSASAARGLLRSLVDRSLFGGSGVSG